VVSGHNRPFTAISDQCSAKITRDVRGQLGLVCVRSPKKCHHLLGLILKRSTNCLLGGVLAGMKNRTL
jgi:hypothetical protein